MVDRRVGSIAKDLISVVTKNLCRGFGCVRGFKGVPGGWRCSSRCCEDDGDGLEDNHEWIDLTFLESLKWQCPSLELVELEGADGDVTVCSAGDQEVGNGALFTSWVCRSWRELALQTSALWSSVEEIDVNWVETAVARTRNQPLHLSLDAQWKSYPDLADSADFSCHPWSVYPRYRGEDLNAISFGGTGSSQGPSQFVYADSPLACSVGVVNEVYSTIGDLPGESDLKSEYTYGVLDL
ncbi:hypothetical protein BDN72DRAFT_859432 [Pluteus cervinus]|uniref:Uncharacterized protein n=1 Tax=Pluteus cervinus TaxID=181527 RepID=A0ACD3ANH2_9AGAR|nr:hypothetical protein BDN72DRAFT_859432 [Pluteus cervinus]